MTILYFTATGNNLYVAKRIGGNLISIPSAVKHETYEFIDDKIGIVFPIFGLSVPNYITEFLKKAKFHSEYIFAVMTYGMIDGGAVSRLVDVGKSVGVNFSYINTLKMVDNYLLGFKMDKEVENEPKKQIESNLQQIITDVNDSKKWIKKNSAIVKMLSKSMAKRDNYSKGITNRFSVQDKCNRCGTCIKVCPTDNISLQDNKIAFATNCISCLACTQNCPQNAIRLSGEKSITRYRNSNVSLKEIIDANKGL